MHEVQLVRGFLANLEILPPLIVRFQFNPATLRDNKSVNYAELHQDLAATAPGKWYSGGGHRTISFDLQLHGLEQGGNPLDPSPVNAGVSTQLAALRSFLYPRDDAWAALDWMPGLGDGRLLSAPPTALFGFGARVLECVVTDLTVEETQFNAWLAPVRATVGVSLTVIEASGHPLYEIDRQRRNALAALNVVDLLIG